MQVIMLVRIFDFFLTKIEHEQRTVNVDVMQDRLSRVGCMPHQDLVIANR